MTEVVTALKAPFVDIPDADRPRPVVMAATWAVVGLLLARAL